MNESSDLSLGGFFNFCCRTTEPSVKSNPDIILLSATASKPNALKVPSGDTNLKLIADSAISMVPAAIPSNEVPLVGRYITLEALSQSHAADLWHFLGFEGDKSILEWLPWHVPNTSDELWEVFETLRISRGFVLFSILGDPNYLNPTASSPVLRRKVPLGTIGYLDYNVNHRTLEVGAVLFGKSLRRSAAATEAHYLLLRNIFEPFDGSPAYRRAAWKNDNLNTASRAAASRIGYVYEGTFRNHMLSQGRSRDSDWLSIIEEEWPKVKEALEKWLDSGNFDGNGRQKRKLEEIRQKLHQPST